MRNTISLVLITLAIMLALAGIIYRPQTSESSSDNDSFPPAESATPAPNESAVPSPGKPINPSRFRLPSFFSSSFANSFSSESAVPVARISVVIRKNATSIETFTVTPEASFNSPAPRQSVKSLPANVPVESVSPSSPEPSPSVPPKDPPSSVPVEALW